MNVRFHTLYGMTNSYPLPPNYHFNAPSFRAAAAERNLLQVYLTVMIFNHESLQLLCKDSF